MSSATVDTPSAVPVVALPTLTSSQTITTQESKLASPNAPSSKAKSSSATAAIASVTTRIKLASHAQQTLETLRDALKQHYDFEHRGADSSRGIKRDDGDDRQAYSSTTKTTKKDDSLIRDASSMIDMQEDDETHAQPMQGTASSKHSSEKAADLTSVSNDSTTTVIANARAIWVLIDRASVQSPGSSPILLSSATASAESDVETQSSQTQEQRVGSSSSSNGSLSSMCLSLDDIRTIVAWTRTRGGQRFLIAARNTLDPLDLTTISLLAGSRTLLSPAEERLVKQNPHLPNSYLPASLQAGDAEPSNKTRAKSSSTTSLRETSSAAPSSSSLSDLRSALASRELAAVANVLFSVLGSGGAVFVVARSSGGMKDGKAMLLAILAALVVAAADAYLYTAHFRRRKHADDPETKQKLIDRELRQKGPTKNNDEQEEQLKVLEDRHEKRVDTTGDASTVIHAMPAADTPRQDHVGDPSAIRLRRRPL